MEQVRKSAYDAEVEQIENIAETKGVEIDEIEVYEGTTDDGDQTITFRVYETYSENEEDAVGVQMTKIPSAITTEMDFRQRVQRKLSSLKSHLSGESTEQTADDEVTESEPTETTESTTTDYTSGDRMVDDYDGTPEMALVERRRELEATVADLEARVDELEEYVDALEGVKRLMGADDE